MEKQAQVEEIEELEQEETHDSRPQHISITTEGATHRRSISDTSNNNNNNTNNTDNRTTTTTRIPGHSNGTPTLNTRTRYEPKCRLEGEDTILFFVVFVASLVTAFDLRGCFVYCSSCLLDFFSLCVLFGIRIRGNWDRMQWSCICSCACELLSFLWLPLAEWNVAKRLLANPHCYGSKAYNFFFFFATLLPCKQEKKRKKKSSFRAIEEGVCVYVCVCEV